MAKTLDLDSLVTQTITSSVVSKTLNPQDVCCPAVSHVRTVHSHGPPQKKGVSPGHCLSKIKHVQGVFCVNPCLSVPSVPNVPSAVAGQTVGGRLQQFWHIWQELGANPQVVSVLRAGYSLPFSQKPLLTRFPLIHSGYANPTKSRFSGLLQPPFSCTQTGQKMETHLGSESVKPVLENQFLQDGNSGDAPVILTDRGMGNLAGLQRCVFPYPNQPKVKKVSEILHEQPNFPIHSSPLWFGHSSPRVYKGGQRSEANGSGQGYPNPPIPRRLVAESPVPGNLPTTYPDPLGPLPTVRMGSQHEEIRVGTPASFQFRRLPVRPCIRSGPPHSRPVDSSPGKIKFHQEPEQLHSRTVHVPDRVAYSHRETGFVGASSYEANSMALETSLACPRGSRGHSGSPVTPSTPRLVVGRKQCTGGPTFAPSSTCSSAVYRRLKRRLGRTLRGLHCKRRLVSHRKSPSHKLLRTKGSPPGLKSFEHLCRDQIVLVATDNTTVVSYINK